MLAKYLCSMAGVILDEKREEKKFLRGFFFVGPFYSTFLLIYIPIVRQVPGIKELFFVQVSDLVMLLFYTKLNWREDKYLPFTCSAFLIEDLTCFGESLVCRRVADTVFFFILYMCVCVRVLARLQCQECINCITNNCKKGKKVGRLWWW